jgi:hypothetical protein
MHSTLQGQTVLRIKYLRSYKMQKPKTTPTLSSIFFTIRPSTWIRVTSDPHTWKVWSGDFFVMVGSVVLDNCHKLSLYHPHYHFRNHFHRIFSLKCCLYACILLEYQPLTSNNMHTNLKVMCMRCVKAGPDKEHNLSVLSKFYRLSPVTTTAKATPL